MSQSRTGVTMRSSGASAWTETSMRTWSFPLPVQPCATAVAPSARAAYHTPRALRRARPQRPRPPLLAVALHPDVRREGDHLVAALLLEPAHGHGGIEASGVRQDYLLAHGHLTSARRPLCGRAPGPRSPRRGPA